MHLKLRASSLCLLVSLASWPNPSAWAQASLEGAPRVRVATYNIRSAAGLGNYSVFGAPIPHIPLPGKSKYNEIAAFLRQREVDVAALQEVQGRNLRSFGVDQSRRIGRRSGLSNSYWVKAQSSFLDLTDRTGNSVISRHPFEVRHDWPLSKEGVSPKRKAAVTKVSVPGFEAGLWLISVHLSNRENEHHQANRAYELSRLKALIQTLEGPIVLAGDFNAYLEEEPIGAILQGSLGRPMGEAVRTAGVPEFEDVVHDRHPRIDFLFHTLDLIPVTARSYPEATGASDHLPVVAEFAILGSGREFTPETEALPEEGAEVVGGGALLGQEEVEGGPPPSFPELARLSQELGSPSDSGFGSLNAELGAQGQPLPASVGAELGSIP